MGKIEFFLSENRVSHKYKWAFIVTYPGRRPWTVKEWEEKPSVTEVKETRELCSTMLRFCREHLQVEWPAIANKTDKIDGLKVFPVEGS